MRGGAAIGIPLTLLQIGIHQHTGAPVDGLTVLNNFAVASAVYDADRIEAPLLSPERLGTRVSLLASSLYYGMHPETAWLAGITAGLHFGYRVVKPHIAPVKPFFVAVFWTLAVYAVPVLRAAGPVAIEPTLPAAFFLSIASLSHAVDVMDRGEDEALGLRTPAVLMGKDEGFAYALALGLAASFLHSQSPADFPLYDAIALLSLIGVVWERAEVTGLLSTAFLLAYFNAHDVEIIGWFLQSTEFTHKMAIDVAARLIDVALVLEEPARSRVVDAVFRVAERGDAVGHALLEVYEHIVRRRL